VAGVFVYAAFTKIPSPAKFALNIQSFKIMPDWALNPMALVLPWFELLAAVLLLFGWWMVEAILIFWGLSFVYVIASASSWLRGIDDEVDCGCFGADYHGTAIHVIGLNVVLIALYWLVLRLRPRTVADKEQSTTSAGRY
jgi:uncharacterized membrane protein YphA (DoxX/SURF4 family)